MSDILTIEGEVILLKTDNGHCYIRINKVESDVKDGWWKVHFSPLTSVPLTDIVWVLDEKQIRGDKFTIKGINHQLEKVEFLISQDNSNQKVKLIPKKSKIVGSNVISMATWKEQKKNKL
jgi:hypothetical protein